MQERFKRCGLAANVCISRARTLQAVRTYDVHDNRSQLMMCARRNSDVIKMFSIYWNNIVVVMRLRCGIFSFVGALIIRAVGSR